jgi:hypothetical protein
MALDFNKFLPTCQSMVADYNNMHPEVNDNMLVQPEEVFLVWYSKTLGNAKALLATPLPDDMYYEITYNGDKDEFYLDAYKKYENVVIPNPNIEGDVE